MDVEGNVRVCAWCRRLLVGDTVAPRRMPPAQLAVLRLRYMVSDGICPDCAAEVREQLAQTQAALEYEREQLARLDGLRG